MTIYIVIGYAPVAQKDSQDCIHLYGTYANENKARGVANLLNKSKGYGDYDYDVESRELV